MTTTSSRVGHHRGSDSGSSPHNLAHGSGVTLRLEGDAIVQGGPRRMLNPDVLAKSRWHKADVITMLRRLADAVPTLPRAAHLTELSWLKYRSSNSTTVKPIVPASGLSHRRGLPRLKDPRQPLRLQPWQLLLELCLGWLLALEARYMH